MNKIFKIYKWLYKEFGRQSWWPVLNKNNNVFEICTGAILTQGTSWKNVEKCIYNLNKNNLLNKKAIQNINIKRLQSFIKSSGYYKQKARKLKEFSKYNFNEKNISRENLLKIWGIGKETADSILLYAYKKPIFVIDGYTKRIFSRVGFKENSYEELQELFHKNLPKDYKIFNEYHALLVELGKKYCKNKPLCIKCPLIKECKFNI